jgi:hypothetical protein
MSGQFNNGDCHKTVRNTLPSRDRWRLIITGRIWLFETKIMSARTDRLNAFELYGLAYAALWVKGRPVSYEVLDDGRALLTEEYPSAGDLVRMLQEKEAARALIAIDPFSRSQALTLRRARQKNV